MVTDEQKEFLDTRFNENPYEVIKENTNQQKQRAKHTRLTQDKLESLDNASQARPLSQMSRVSGISRRANSTIAALSLKSKKSQLTIENLNMLQDQAANP